jgi:redox-sensitive bicupin YhaK (pirin superfamily)
METITYVPKGTVEHQDSLGNRGVIGPGDVQSMSVTAPEYLDITVPAGGVFVGATPRGHTVFAYVIEGRALFSEQDDPFDYDAEGDMYFDEERNSLIGDRHLVHFGDGDAIEVSAREQPLRFLLVSGTPIGEPIAWRGPIVMTTQDEIRTAFHERDRATFIEHARPAG